MEVSRYVENLKTKFVNIDDKKELLKEITKQLTPKEMEKKLLGEVFTPLDLVEKMLDTLNKEKEVWTNPDLKWLEPGSGIGNFSICVFYRLMEGLKPAIPDAAKRERHIIENMLYMAELNPANVHICKSVFKAKKNGYKLNIYEGDFLELDPEKEWGISEFDVIVGNPPYNSGGTGAMGKSIYGDFIETSFMILKQNAYLLFIGPCLWRSISKGGKDINILLTSKQILYLKLINLEDVQKLMGVQVKLDYFLIENKKPYKKTIIHNTQNIIQTHLINKSQNIPDFGMNIYTKIKDKTKQLGDLSDITRGITNNSNNILLIGHGKNKVVLSRNSNVDDKWYVISEPNENTILFFNSNIFLFLREICQWTGYALPKALFLDIPNLNNLLKNLNNHIDLYNYFGLTKDEIIEIEKTLDSRARHHSTLEELSLFSTSHTTYSNVVKTPAKKLIRVDKLKQSAGYSQSTSIEQQKTDKLQYILQNIHKIDIKYKIFEKKLIELGVNIDYIPKLWNKYYLQLKN
jgi:hypothetical protein